jgi:hypothetical protein
MITAHIINLKAHSGNDSGSISGSNIGGSKPQR